MKLYHKALENLKIKKQGNRDRKRKRKENKEIYIEWKRQKSGRRLDAEKN